MTVRTQKVDEEKLQSAKLAATSVSWSERYGEKHKWLRLNNIPSGFNLPKKVRIYQRAEQYILSWWDPSEKRNRAERLVGDLLAALSKARQIDERVTAFRTGGVSNRTRIGHTEIVNRFLADLTTRADAREIVWRTVNRYRSALVHYEHFCDQPEVQKRYPVASAVDREFRLKITTFLSSTLRTRAGKPIEHSFVLDVVRAMFEWAADPDRGALFGEGFRNPFRRAAGHRSVMRGDPLAPPDVTLKMAIDLVSAADHYQLRLFVPIMLFGLRAAEPCWLFAEHLRDGWLRVPCLPELDLQTKGKRDKTLPLIDDLTAFWTLLTANRKEGLLLVRREIEDGTETCRLRNATLAELAEEYRRRSTAERADTAAKRARIVGSVLHDAGALTYDHLEGEFCSLADKLGWPAAATLKDLRHLFATAMNDAAMPDAYRRYLLGHSPGKGAVVAYTHLTALREVYTIAVRKEWSTLVSAINARVAQVHPHSTGSIQA